MKAISFKGQTMVAAKDQKEYLPLPVLVIKSENGEVISCWSLSLWERLKVLFTGKVWLCLLSFNRPFSPSRLSVHRKEMFILPTDKEYKAHKAKEAREGKGNPIMS